MAQLPQLLIAQAHRDRPSLHRKRRPKSNCARRKASVRPALGAEVAYRKALRDVVALWQGRIEEAIGGLLAGSVQSDDVSISSGQGNRLDTRADARETPLQKAIRVGTRPANDAVGTTGSTRELSPVEKVNLVGVENTDYLREGMRDLTAHRG